MNTDGRTKAETVASGEHELLVGNDNADGANDVHRPSSHIRDGTRFLLALHLQPEILSAGSLTLSPMPSPGADSVPSPKLNRLRILRGPNLGAECTKKKKGQ